MGHRLRIEGEDFVAGQTWRWPAYGGDWLLRIVRAGPVMVSYERIAPSGTIRKERMKRYRLANELRLFGCELIAD